MKWFDAGIQNMSVPSVSIFITSKLIKVQCTGSWISPRDRAATEATCGLRPDSDGGARRGAVQRKARKAAGRSARGRSGGLGSLRLRRGSGPGKPVLPQPVPRLLGPARGRGMLRRPARPLTGPVWNLGGDSGRRCHDVRRLVGASEARDAGWPLTL